MLLFASAWFIVAPIWFGVACAVIFWYFFAIRHAIRVERPDDDQSARPSP
jgi:hypothetical protein